MDSVKLRLRICFIIFVGVMALGTFGFMITEGLSLGDAFYFSIVTITTVGYGDIHPASAAGKWLTIILIVTGVWTFLGVVANAAEIMLSKRERKARLQKLHMVIGAFFSDVGTKLLELFSDGDPHLDQVREYLIITAGWNEQDFRRVRKALKNHEYGIHAQKGRFQRVTRFSFAEERLLAPVVGESHLAGTRILYRASPHGLSPYRRASLPE